jgi:hypothetical protein
VDLTFANYNIYRELEKRMSKPKLHQKLIFASGTMIQYSPDWALMWDANIGIDLPAATIMVNQ